MEDGHWMGIKTGLIHRDTKLINFYAGQTFTLASSREDERA